MLSVLLAAVGVRLWPLRTLLHQVCEQRVQAQTTVSCASFARLFTQIMISLKHMRMLYLHELVILLAGRVS